MNDRKIKCVIVDDEPIGREIVEAFVSQTTNLQLLASCEDAFEALDILQHELVDLLFSDIQMPRVNGLELVRSLPNPPAIVFITAHDNFAIDGYELNVTDYLMKPVSYERFLKAVNKAILQIDVLRKSAHNDNVTSKNPFIFLKADNKLNKVLIDDISYIESLRDYLKFIFNDKKSLIVHSTMKAIEEKLPADNFFRIHKSCLVALKQVKSIMGNSVELYNDTSLLIAQARKEELYKALNITEG